VWGDVEKSKPSSDTKHLHKTNNSILNRNSKRERRSLSKRSEDPVSGTAESFNRNTTKEAVYENEKGEKGLSCKKTER